MVELEEPKRASELLKRRHVVFLGAQRDSVVSGFVSGRETLGQAMGRFADITQQACRADAAAYEQLESQSDALCAHRRRQLEVGVRHDEDRAASAQLTRVREEMTAGQAHATDTRVALQAARRLQAAAQVATDTGKVVFKLQLGNLDALEAETKRRTDAVATLQKGLLLAIGTHETCKRALAEAEVLCSSYSNLVMMGPHII